ncbi:MAG: JAB domain-containing protein [bacterium]|nr:JAB domain-containing protein [bacterium]
MTPLKSKSSLLPFPKALCKAPLASEDLPRERLLRSGAAILSDAELLGLVLRGGAAPEATELAQGLLTKVGGLAGLLRSHQSDLALPGVGPARRAAILASVELARRIARARMPRRDLLDQPEVVARYLGMRYAQQDQEVMGALYLDVRNRLIAESDIYRGTLSRAAVEPRVILKEGLLRSASGFILFHTHPSGDPTPSAEDLAFTRRLAEAGDLLGVRLIDHLILGSAGRWVSLGRRGAW